MGCFAVNLGHMFIFEAELHVFIYYIHHGWFKMWLEGDSTSVFLAFMNSSLVQANSPKRWYNYFRLGVEVISSNIFREGNKCADKLIVDILWCDMLPSILRYKKKKNCP